MDPHQPRTSLGGRWANWWVQSDQEERLRNREWLRALIRDHGDQVQAFCAHDPAQLATTDRGTGQGP
jgi:hypothetical protein